ncbi:unnamed protein product [Clonostachys byssicola]|uniref:G domain-containing protein n=1 Tax=Clonostachys byssicola TaxID=160290 RepID=A0A9N9U7L8_9HYPO|nr:unnamed protein product [Clonostachys byssicola]
MNPEIESVNERLEDQARRLSALIGATKPRATDRFFLVLGRTGSGKSTFISRCTGKDTNISHGLFSCTDSLDVFDMRWEGRRIYLIDTPGFNDTNRPEIDTLSVLATYLGASYSNGVRISGVLMLHPISDNRMSGTNMRTIEMIEAMCGFDSYDNLAIATTMWPEQSTKYDRATLNAREAELAGSNKFYGSMISKGAAMFRLHVTGRKGQNGEVFSAERILAHLIRRSDLHAPKALRLQKELIDEKKTIGETSAGAVIAADISRHHQVRESALQQLEERIREHIYGGSKSRLAELRQSKAAWQQELKKLEEGNEKLRQSMEDLGAKEFQKAKQKIDEIEDHLMEQVNLKEEDLKDMEDSLHHINNDRSMALILPKTPEPDDGSRSSRQNQTSRQRTPSPTPSATPSTAPSTIERHLLSQNEELMRLVRIARRDASEMRRIYAAFKGKTRDQAINGTVNGVAAGAMSGIIAAVAAGGLLCSVM